MKKSKCKSYDKLPPLLNAETVAWHTTEGERE